jgi:MFS family permease
MGKDYLSPEEITESKVEGLIHKYEQVSAGIAKPEPAPAPALTPTPEEVKKAEESMIERFRSLGILTVVSAGLIDGVNPCAFATLIFFISYLSFVGRKRNEILWVGIGFSGSVFLTYLLIGFGIGGQITSGIMLTLEFAAPGRQPTYAGLVNTSLGLAGIAAPLIGAWMAVHGFTLLFAVSAVLNLGAILVLHVRVTDPRHLPAAAFESPVSIPQSGVEPPLGI